MIHKMARYKIKEHWMDQVIPVIEEFVDLVGQREPATSYVVFRQGAGRDFVHFMSFQDQSALEAHLAARYTQIFWARISPNCEIQPEITDLISVASSMG